MTARVNIAAAATALAALAALALPAALAVAGAYQEVRAPRLMPGDPIPAPRERVVLTVHGATAEPNQGRHLAFDIPTLEQMGLVRYTNRNRWYAGPVTYEGVLGSDFLDIVGVPEGADTLYMRALNDFVTRVPIADLRRWPVMLALKLDGEYMSVRDKGPIWLVYPTHVNEALGGPAHQGKWIWQLTEIRFQ